MKNIVIKNASLASLDFIQVPAIKIYFDTLNFLLQAGNRQNKKCN